jgi:hypothetical protein
MSSRINLWRCVVVNEIRSVRLMFTLVIAVGCATSHVAAQTIYRCTNDKGETVYSDRECGDSSETITIDATPPSTTPAAPFPPAQTFRKSVDDSVEDPDEKNNRISEPFSFRCDAASGETWYSHDPCPQQIRKTETQTVSGPSTGITSTGQVVNLVGNSAQIETESWVPVQQTIVSTDEACQNGAVNRSSLYAISAAPCSFVGKRLRLREQNRDSR